MAWQTMGWRVAVACAGWLAGVPATAVTLGQTDTFASGALAGWSSGAAHPYPPRVVASGGPGGADDGFLLLTATGQPGAGGKLVAFAGPQWAGDYLGAGVTGLRMAVDNFGDTALDLRLALVGANGGSVLSTNAVALAPGSGWTTVRFSLLPAALTGPAPAVLANVGALRLFHATTAAYPGAEIAAALGVDNVSAVPEAGSAALMAGGLLALAALSSRAGTARRAQENRP